MDRRLERGTRTDGTPSWWRGREDATQASLAAARALGLTVPDLSGS